MNKKELEVRVMKHFAENVNLHDFMEIATTCAAKRLHLDFNNIITGDFQMPSEEEMKEMTVKHIPYDFNADDFKSKGPLDFSSAEYEDLEEAMEKIESIYKKFHEAQAVMVAKAGIKAMEKMVKNMTKEINELKDKYLGGN